MTSPNGPWTESPVPTYPQVMTMNLPSVPVYLTQNIDLAIKEDRLFEAALLSTARDAVMAFDDLAADNERLTERVARLEAALDEVIGARLDALFDQAQEDRDGNT